MKDEVKTEHEEEPQVGAAPAPPSASSFILHPSSFHRMRLGPPWQLTTTDASAHHARKFGRPRTLSPTEQLWLVCAHVPGPGAVRVNGELVGTLEAPGAFAADITALLLPRNEVTFTVASGAPLGAVALEVRTVE
jgi:hypothetical protein